VVEPEPEEEPDIEIERDQMAAWLTDESPVHLVDIREGHEVQHGYAVDAQLIPMNDIPQRLDDLPDKDARVVIYCAVGGRSYGVTGYLRDQGWTDVWSLVGGFGAYLAAGGTDALHV
jgi:rhodanese-related sulfurtransferase